MRKYLLLTILLSGLTLGARGQSDPEIDLSGLPQKTTASSLRYWFDSNANSVKTTETLSGATTIDASSLKEGIHTVHYQIVDNKGIAGIPDSKIFIRLNQRVVAKSKSLRYWFDTDATSLKTTETLTGATTIDASVLKEGIHTIHYQIIDDQGVAGITDSKIFILLDQRVTAKSKSLRYWFDTDANSAKTTETLSGATTIDASAIKEGIHTIHYQIIDDQNIAGITYSKMFIKIDEKVNAKANKLRYWFDTDKGSVVETDRTEGVQTVDASALADGIHTIHYQIIDDKNTADIPASAMFIKFAKKTVAKATKIRYWFNEDDANIKETALDLENLTMTIDASSLTKGTHELHMQLMTENGEVTPANSGSFVSILIKKGDANLDNVIDENDIVVITNYIMGENYVGESQFDKVNADFNSDEVINIADILGIVNIIITTGKQE